MAFPQAAESANKEPLFATYQIGHLVEEIQIVRCAVKLPFYYKFLRTINFRWLENYTMKRSGLLSSYVRPSFFSFSPNKALKILPFKYTP